MNYADMTLKQLKAIATERKIAGRSKATRKAQVIALLENWDYIESLEDDGLTGEYGVTEVSEEEIQAAKLDAEIEADKTVRRAAIAAVNCVVEVTEEGYNLRGVFQVFRGNPNNRPARTIAKGARFQVIRFCGNEIRIDYEGQNLMIHEDYVNIRFNSSNLSAA